MSSSGESGFHVDMFPSLGNKSEILFNVVDCDQQSNESQGWKDQLKVTGDKADQALARFTCTHKFVEYLLWSRKFEERRYGISTGTSIQSLWTIRHALEEIKTDYLQLLSDRDLAIGFAVRTCRASTQSALQNRRCEPPPDSNDKSDEASVPEDYVGQSLVQAGAFHLDYIVRSAHHFSFSPHIDHLMVRRCGLARYSYHSLWDGVFSSPDPLHQLVGGSYSINGHKVSSCYPWRTAVV